MKINISDIPEEGLDVSSDEEVDLDGVPTTLGLELSLRKVGAEVLVSGTVTGKAPLTCGRCLKGFEQEVRAYIDTVYRPVGEPGEDEQQELRQDEMDTGFYRNDELDLAEITKEQLLLGIPMKPLCGEGCKGLCPRCGKDLNEGPCQCGAEPKDSRFAALKKLTEGSDG